MTSIHKIENISFEKDYMKLNIDGNNPRMLLNKLSVKLSTATVIERAMYKISPSGYGIYWPLIDEDLSFEGIIRDFGK